MKTKLLKRAALSALGVIVYIAIFAFVISHAQQWFGNTPDSWVNPVLFLTTFIVSACITGSLVLLKPLLLYLDGQKKDAVQLFGLTVACLALFALLLGVYVIMQSRPVQTSPLPEQTGQHCGGNMANAPTCGVGYHCAPVPGSNLPFGDVGGVCVNN